MGERVRQPAPSSESAANCIENNEKEILKEWETRARARLSAARPQSRLALVDALPEFLKKLAEFLSLGAHSGAVPSMQELGKEHGEQRAELSGYSVSQVLEEYDILRQVLFEKLRASGGCSERESELILIFFGAVAREAAEHFVQHERAVTERIRFEAIAADRRLREIVNWLDHAIVWEAIADTMAFTFVSLRAEHLLGYLREEWLDEPGFFMKIVHPEDRDRVQALLHRVRSAGAGDGAAKDNNDQRCEHRLIAKNGSVLWHQTGVHLDRETGKALFRAVTVDIGSLKKTEEALKESEVRFRGLFEQSPFSTVIFSTDGRMLGANPAAARLWGRNEEAFAGILGDYNVFGDPYAQRIGIAAEMRKAFRGESVRMSPVLCDPKESLGVNSGGAMRWVESFVYPLRDASGKIKEVVLNQADITDKIEAVAALREREERYRTIVEALQEGVTVRDAKLEKIIEANESALKILDLPRDKLLGTSALDPSWQAFRGDGTPLGSADQPSIRAIRSGRPIRYEELKVRRLDGSWVWLSANAIPIFRPGEKTPHAVVSSFADITERRKAEEALRESERQFRNLADAIPQLAWQADPSGRRTWFNQKWLDYTGIPSEQSLGWGWKKAHHPDHVERVISRIQDAWKRGEAWEDTYPLRSKTGEWRWFLSRALPIRDPRGEAVRWFGTSTDITDQLNTQDELRKSRKTIDLALKAGQIGIWEMDLNSPAIQWSKRQYEIFDVAPTTQPLTYDIFLRNIFPDDLPRIEKELKACLEENRDFFLEYRVIHRNKSIRWVRADGRVFHDAAGKPQRMIGTNIDITKEKMAEKEREELLARVQGTLDELKVSELRFRELANAMPQMVWASDPEGKLDYYNDQWLEYAGQGFEKSLGLGWKQVVHPEDLEKTVLSWNEAIREGKPYQIEHRLRRKDGSYFWHLSRALPVFDSNQRLVRWYGTATNINEQKKSEEKLYQAIQAREDLLAVVSHDLRNPLGSILMNASLLKRKIPQEGEPARIVLEQTDKIRRAGERMNTLIEDLLNLTKIEAGHLRLTLERCPVSTIMGEVIEVMSPLAAEKDIQFVIDAPDEKGLLACERNQLVRVFLNLIGNAFKFTPVHGEVVLRGTPENGFMRFSVRDTGPGIAEQHIPHIFERYWQATRTAHKGTGLGLAIAKGIVEAHGGKIWVESKFGDGATFHFTIPLGKSAVAA